MRSDPSKLGCQFRNWQTWDNVPGSSRTYDEAFLVETIMKASTIGWLEGTCSKVLDFCKLFKPKKRTVWTWTQQVKEDIWISNLWKNDLRSFSVPSLFCRQIFQLSTISELLANQRIERCPGLEFWNMWLHGMSWYVGVSKNSGTSKMDGL